MNTNKEGCYKDSDCGNNEMCIFDYEVCKNSIECKNICINKNEYFNNPMCVENSKYNELNSSNINKNLNTKNKEECIEWAKKQECTKNNSCNSIIYRHKEHSIIDTFKGIAHIITNKAKQILESSDHKKFKLHHQNYLNNTYDNDNSHLNYSYKCTNNGGEFNSEKLKLNSNINTECPINKNDEKFKNVCAVLNINNNDKKPYHNLNCDFNLHNNHTLPKSKKELLKYDENKKNYLMIIKIIF